VKVRESKERKSDERTDSGTTTKRNLESPARAGLFFAFEKMGTGLFSRCMLAGK
jgi:hypothetical protein